MTSIDFSDKKILDVTCGARSIWFDKHHPAAIYCDKRREEYHNLWKNAGNCTLDINPDVLCDFTDLPFPAEVGLPPFQPFKMGSTSGYGRRSPTPTALSTMPGSIA